MGPISGVVIEGEKFELVEYMTTGLFQPYTSHNIHVVCVPFIICIWLVIYVYSYVINNIRTVIYV